MAARTVPTMPSWGTGAMITSSLLNQITAYAVFWANPPMFRMYQATVQPSIASTTLTQITMDTSQYDTDSGRNSTTPWSYTIPPGMGGRWYFGVTVAWANNTTGNRAAALYQNGVQVQGAFWQSPAATGASASNVGGFTEITVNAGDVMSAYGEQTSGGNLATFSSSNISSFFEGKLVSLGSP